MDFKILMLIIIAIAIVTLLVYLLWKYVKNNSFEQIREDVYKLYLVAEHKITGTKRGQERMDWVCNQAYYLLPKFVQALITMEDIRSTLDTWFKMVKDLLDDGKLNDSTKEGE